MSLEMFFHNFGDGNLRQANTWNHGWWNLFQSGGGASARHKTLQHFCGLNWQLWCHRHWNMTSLPIHHMKV